MFRHCHILSVSRLHWRVLCTFCGLEWKEPRSDRIVVAVTCPHCEEMQGVMYPDGVEYKGPVVETELRQIVDRLLAQKLGYRALAERVDRARRLAYREATVSETFLSLISGGTP